MRKLRGDGNTLRLAVGAGCRVHVFVKPIEPHTESVSDLLAISYCPIKLVFKNPLEAGLLNSETQNTQQGSLTKGEVWERYLELGFKGLK